MDPLSITASVIAILQAVATTTSVIQELVELRHADREVSFYITEVYTKLLQGNNMLSLNQISSFQTALKMVITVVKRLPHQTILGGSIHQCLRDIDCLAVQALPLFSDTEKALRSVLKPSRAVSKFSWFMQKGRIKKQVSRIPDITRSLGFCLMALTLLMSANSSLYAVDLVNQCL
jgi:hypothetical protein